MLSRTGCVLRRKKGTALLYLSGYFTRCPSAGMRYRVTLSPQLPPAAALRRVRRADVISLHISIGPPSSLVMSLPAFRRWRRIYLPGIAVPSVAVDLPLADGAHGQAVVPPQPLVALDDAVPALARHGRVTQALHIQPAENPGADLGRKGRHEVTQSSSSSLGAVLACSALRVHPRGLGVGTSHRGLRGCGRRPPAALWTGCLPAAMFPSPARCEGAHGVPAWGPVPQFREHGGGAAARLREAARHGPATRHHAAADPAGAAPPPFLSRQPEAGSAPQSRGPEVATPAPRAGVVRVRSRGV